jgi:hypothetical protein
MLTTMIALRVPAPARAAAVSPSGVSALNRLSRADPALKELPMKYPPCLRNGLLALSLSLAALPVLADDDCDAPLNRWQSRDAVRQMAVAQGWQIQRLKIDDGCYEVRGTDAQGRSFKARIDPETLRVLKLKQDDHQRDRDRDRNAE